MALHSLGVKARSFTGAQAGIYTDNVHGSARIKEVRTQALEAALARGEVAIVAGFQGISDEGEICTLGRGGSDTTAVALAAALKSDSCDIYTDVNGVYTADPNVLPAARKLEAISYEEMLELAASGAQVLNARSVELAMNMQVPIRLRSTFEPENPGTLITHRFDAPEYTVCGIACDTNQVAVRMKLPSAIPGDLTQENITQLEGISTLFQRLHKIGVTAETVTLIGHEADGQPELIFTVNKRSARKVESIIEELKDELGDPDVSVDGQIARISVIGSGLSCRRGVVAAIFDTLCSASIPIQMLTTGDIRVTALVPDRYKDDAIQHIHERFCIYPPVDSRIFS